MANEVKQRLLADRAKHLIALGESPSYPVLKDIVDGRIRVEIRKLIATPEISQQQLDYFRGLLRGMQLVLDTVEKGPQEFERVMKQIQSEE